MASLGAAFAVAVAAVQTALFAVVGATFLARDARHDAPRTARDAMATWWFALALSTAAGGLLGLMALLTSSPVELAADVTLLELGGLCAGLAGLLYYMTYLATGWTRMLWPITLAYAAVFVWLSQRVAAWNPVGVEGPSWSLHVVYAHPPGAAATTLLLVLLIAPQFLVAAALGMVALRLPRGPSRQRATVLAVGILVWFGLGLVGQAAGTASGAAWSVVQALLGMGVAVAVLWVYRASERGLHGARATATAARSPSRGEAER
ncbi:MAG TPA: hypothetical protein VKB31_01515 [Trueperaceae bacterium]|nr:hypothetical protein [Trueperaceae bacterium]